MKQEKLVKFLEKKGFKKYIDIYYFLPENSTCDIFINGWQEPCWGQQVIWADIKSEKIKFSLGYKKFVFPIPKPNWKIEIEREIHLYLKISESDDYRVQYPSVAGDVSYVSTGRSSEHYMGCYKKKQVEPCYKIGNKIYVKSTAYHGIPKWIAISEATPEKLKIKVSDYAHHKDYQEAREELTSWNEKKERAEKSRKEAELVQQKKQQQKEQEKQAQEQEKQVQELQKQSAEQEALRVEIATIYNNLHPLVLNDSEYQKYYTIVEMHRYYGILSQNDIDHAKDLQYQILLSYWARKKNQKPTNNNKKR